MHGQFDYARFYTAIDAARRRRSIAWRQVAAESGVSASSLTRMGGGSKPDLDTVVALASWASVDLNAFTITANERSDYLSVVASYLREDPSLDAASVEALESLLSATYSQLSRDRNQT